MVAKPLRIQFVIAQLAVQDFDQVLLVRLPQDEPVQEPLSLQSVPVVQLLARGNDGDPSLYPRAVAHPPGLQPGLVGQLLSGQ